MKSDNIPVLSISLGTDLTRHIKDMLGYMVDISRGNTIPAHLKYSAWEHIYNSLIEIGELINSVNIAINSNNKYKKELYSLDVIYAKISKANDLYNGLEYAIDIFVTNLVTYCDKQLKHVSYNTMEKSKENYESKYQHCKNGLDKAKRYKTNIELKSGNIGNILKLWFKSNNP